MAPKPTALNWDAWREALAIALQRQYGTARTWDTVSEIARNGWRNDAAEIMASLPYPPSGDAR
jgi:hypothetical protein